MFGILALLFLVVPIAELYVIVQVSDQIGFGSTLLAVIGVSMLGAWMVKAQGLNVVRRLQGQVQRGAMPTNELIDGGLVLFAGALMLTPGFLTDLLGLVLLFPPSRAVVRAVLRKRFAGRMIVSASGFPGAARTSRAPGTDGIWDADSWENDPPSNSPERPELP